MLKGLSPDIKLHGKDDAMSIAEVNMRKYEKASTQHFPGVGDHGMSDIRNIR